MATFFDMGGFAPEERRAVLRQELTSTIRLTQGVGAAAASLHVPLSGDTFSHFFRLPDDAEDETKVARFAYVSPG